MLPIYWRFYVPEEIIDSISGRKHGFRFSWHALIKMGGDARYDMMAASSFRRARIIIVEVRSESGRLPPKMRWRRYRIALRT